MTEAERDACTDPNPMLEFLRRRGSTSERKLRLFACACCRRVRHLLDPECQEAIWISKRYADGEAGAAELRDARAAALWAAEAAVKKYRLAARAVAEAAAEEMAGAAAATSSLAEQAAVEDILYKQPRQRERGPPGSRFASGSGSAGAGAAPDRGG